MTEAVARCPRCDAPRVPAPDCPMCGVVYAKAEARLAREAAEAPAGDIVLAEPVGQQEELPPAVYVPPPEPNYAPIFPMVAADDRPAFVPPVESHAPERWLRRLGIPGAMAFFWLLEQSEGWHSLIRIFLSMWIHELGHGVTAWLCGFSAIPGPWRTSLASERSVVVALFFFAVWGFLGLMAFKLRRFGWVAVCAVLLVLQTIGSVVLSSNRAHALISFGGDGGLFVLGSLLMLTIYAPPESMLRRGGARLGFLVIGAASFADGWITWWAVKKDWANLPLGNIEGTGASDPTVLLDRHHWTELEILHRYLGLGAACAAVLLALWAWQLTRRVEDE